MKMAPQTSGVARTTPSRLGLARAYPSALGRSFRLVMGSRRPVIGGGIGPLLETPKNECVRSCDRIFDNCDLFCGQFYPDSNSLWLDCRHGCIIGYDICLAGCQTLPA